MNCTPAFPAYPQDFYQQILNFLCVISKQLTPGGEGIRYDWEILCDPNSGNPICLRNSYNTDGTLLTPAAFLLDGTAYPGILTQLVACSGGGGAPPGGPIRYTYEVVCSPLNGQLVLLRQQYNIDGTGIVFAAFNPDGTAYVLTTIGSLVACTAAAQGTARFDYEVLCNPSTGVPVILRAQYNINGTQTGFTAFTLDGAAYGGSITALVACGAGSSDGYQWFPLCSAASGILLYVRVKYDATGLPLDITAFYPDLSPYTGDLLDLVDCSSVSDGGVSWFPSIDTTTYIPNLGTGLQTVQQNIITFNSSGSNPFNYPSRATNYRIQWKEIEDATQGVYDLTVPFKACDQAAAARQQVNLRVYSYDPASGYTPPLYAYTIAGWTITSANGAGTFQVCFFGDAGVIAGFQSMLSAVNGAIGSHPGIGVIDAGWGEFDENTYSGSAYVGPKTGSAPVVSVGAELPPLTLLEAQGFYNAYRNAFGTDNILVTHAANQNSFNYPVGALNFGARMDGWGYRNNPASCPGGQVQMCTDAVNTFLSSGTYPNTWKNAPILMETWDRLYGTPGSWVTQNYDFTGSFLWASNTAHVSEINIKSRFNPPTSAPDMKTPFDVMLRNLGYRFAIVLLRHPKTVVAGTSLVVDVTIHNYGNSPTYRNHVLAVRLFDAISTRIVYTEVTTVNVKSILEGGESTYSVSVNVPTWFPASTVRVRVALVNPTTKAAEVQFANTGDNGDWWYSATTSGATVDVINASVTAAPAQVQAATFNGTTQFFTGSSTRTRCDATDFTHTITVPTLDTGARRCFFSKGEFNNAGAMEYWCGYSALTDRIVGRVSNGATVYTVSADNFGPITTLPSSAFPLKVWFDFDNTSKIMSIRVNGSLANSTTITGSIPATSQIFRIGNDVDNNFMQGQLCLWRMYKNIVTTPAREGILLNPYYVPFNMLSNAQRYGMYFSAEITGVAGTSLVDPICNLPLTDNGTIGRVTVQSLGN